MCGICGQLSFDGQPVSPERLTRMARRLQHRGPDDHGIWAEGAIGLGHSRLSIIDLSSAGHQPMTSAGGDCVIVFNGEIYNYQELRSQLAAQGEILRTATDTEVILLLFEKYGPECLAHLRGMFAFAIWDRRRKTLFAARDRLGIKPFYYYHDPKRFVFGSEIKAITECAEANLEISLPAISKFFCYGHSLAPQTIYKNVLKLEPGHWLEAGAAGVRVKRYWEIPTKLAPSKSSLKLEAANALDRIRDCVRHHLIADVPVGVFLSGGIDSSLIAAIAAEQVGAGLQTFAVGFDIGGYYSELPDARLVANAIGANHREIVVGALDVPPLIEQLVYHYDEPFADAACLPTFLIAQFARQHVKVVLSGEGGDEVFGGYRRYVTALKATRLRRSRIARAGALLLRSLVESRPGWRRAKKALETFAFADSDERYANLLTSFTAPMREALFAGATHESDHELDCSAIYKALSAEAGNDPVNRLLYTDLKTWLPDTYLEKVDKATMAVGLEARVPLLDHTLVEYAFSLPGDMKIAGFRMKVILRAAAQGIVPDRIINKPKHGFAVPLDEWFRGSLRDYAGDILLDGRLDRRGYFRPGAVEHLLADHWKRQNDYGTQIWQLLNFELWHRAYPDCASRSTNERPTPFEPSLATTS